MKRYDKCLQAKENDLKRKNLENNLSPGGSYKRGISRKLIQKN